MQRSIFIFAAMAVLLLNMAAATNYTVGAPTGGWDQSTDLQTWASSITFLSGDSLIFSYSTNHDVVEVPEADYTSCQITSPIQTYNGGSTVIPLPAPAKRYFVCGTAGHCASGMKVEIDVLAANSPPPSSPATPPPSSPPATPPSSSNSPALSPSPKSSSPEPASSPENSLPSPPSTTSNSPVSSPTSSSAVPPPPPSSANKKSFKACFAVGFGLVVTMVLVL